MATKVRDKQLVSQHTEWIGDSYLRVTVEKIRSSDKIVVEVMELTHSRIARKGTALRLARNAARAAGAASMDSTTLNQFSARKEAMRVDDCKPFVIKVLHSYFVFHGVN